MKYLLTSYGVVYEGFEFDIPNKHNLTTVVQRDHFIECNSLLWEKRTIEKFRQIGWVLPTYVIVK